tara:strand:+ start:65495 stop:66706 length:1212 start_codon:yes stop_codon:yes gene_type:complete
MNKQPSLKRSMNLLTLTFYGLGTIIGAGIYVLIGEVAAAAGTYMTFSFLLAGIIALFTALSYTELASRFPVSAGEAVYVNKAWNKGWLSGLVGWMIIFTGIVSAAAITNGFVGYLNIFVSMQAPLAITILCITLCGITIYGIRLSAATVFMITVFELAGLGYVIWVAGSNLGDGVTQNISGVSEHKYGLNGIFLGTFLAFYAFIGFEDMVNVIEEVKNPLRNFPIALLLAISLAVLCYLSVSYAVLRVSTPEFLAQSDAPLADLVALAGADPAIIALISLIAVVNGALVQIIMASRVIYGLAKIKLAPTLLGRINPFTRTPLVATILVSALVLLFALLMPLASLAKLTSLIMLLVFVIINVALLSIKSRQEESTAIIRIPVLIPVLGAATASLLVIYQLFSLF